MGWIRALTTNRAELKPDERDPGLRTVAWSCPPSEAVSRAARILARLPRWRVLETAPDRGTLHATHTTRLWRFVDDVYLTMVPEGDGCRITGFSQSRIGKGDLGQNARNLRELMAALGSEDGRSSRPNGHEGQER